MIEKNGFLVRPNADGDVYGIPLHDYRNNIDKTTQLPTLTGLSPKRFLGSQNQWIECRFIKIYAHNDSHFVTTATAINVGFTI
jgi:hypothetical protein